MKRALLSLVLAAASVSPAWAQAPAAPLAAAVPQAPEPEPADPALIPVTPRRGYLPHAPALWETMHQENLATARAHAGPVPVVLLGDSITANWGKRPGLELPENVAIWDKHFPGAPFLNFGIGGDTTGNILWRIQNGELDGLQPRLIVLAVGVNNTWNPAVPPAAIAAGVQKCVEALRQRFAAAQILVINVFPVMHTPDHPMRQRVDGVRQAIAAIPWAQQPGVHFADPGPRLLQPDGTISRQITEDGVHPGPAGYELYASGLDEIVPRLLREK